MLSIYGGTGEDLSKTMIVTLKGNNYVGNIDLFKDDNVEIGQVSLTQNSFKSYEYDELVIFLDGYVFNNDLLERDRTSFLKKIANAYISDSLDLILREANGYFCGVLYDKRKKKIVLFSDRLGTRFLYYYHKNGIFYFSGTVNSILSINTVDKTIDKDSLDCFVNDRGPFYLLADNTYFRNIKLLKPATILEFSLDSNEVHQHYYWTFEYITPRPIIYEDAIDELHRLIEKAVLKRAYALGSSEFALPLSGGLDSRLIFAILNNHNIRPSYVFTNGSTQCTDVKYAKSLCKKFQYEHKIVLPNRRDLLQSAQKAALLCEGMCPFFEFCEYDYPFPNRFVISGYLGDMLFGETFKSDSNLFDKAMDSAIAEKFYGRFHKLSDINDQYFNIKKIEAHLLINRVRRFTAHMLNVELNYNEQLLPFIDNDIIDFVYSIPDSYRAKNHLYADMLLKYYPKYYEKIPWNRIDLPIQGRIYKNDRYNMNWLFKKIDKSPILTYKTKKSLKKRINYHKWFVRPTFHVFNEELKKERNIQFVTNLYNNSLIRQYFTPESWLAVGKGIENKDTWFMAKFLTVELYFRGLLEQNFMDSNCLKEKRS